MAAILAALKSLSVLFDFVKWAAEFVRGLIVENKKQRVETTHTKNEQAIDDAFSVPASGGVPVDSSGKPSDAPPGASAVPGGTGSGSGLG